MNKLFLSLIGLPVAFAGVAGQASAHMRGPGNGMNMPTVAVVAADQVPAQKTTVQQALDAVKVSFTKLQADVTALQTQQKALLEAQKGGDAAAITAAKTKVEQARTTLKATREAHHAAMQKFMTELLKLPEADRAAFRDQLKTMHEAHKDMREDRSEFAHDLKRGRKEFRQDRREGLREGWNKRVKELQAK